MSRSPHIISRDQMAAQVEPRTHPIDASVQRLAYALGDATGLTRIGIHYTVLEPGQTSTVAHVHHFSDEFLLVLQGHPRLSLDSETIDLAPGDFVGLPANGPCHLLHNPTLENAVYIVGGDRAPHDVCDYPRIGRRAYIYDENGRRNRDIIRRADLDEK